MQSLEEGREADLVDAGVKFFKLHVPSETLKKYAEILKMRMPLKVREHIIRDFMFSCGPCQNEGGY